ncbi:peroxiredoxin family protein [Halosimplex amylolyticum]|uniref:peroxiredoxin family protein n=1 Tax=Halosimplex amylolyticum TaxID=3396616 RepID=UPI003F54771F
MNHPLAAPEFLLANVGPGPDPCSLAALDDAEFVVLVFLRDFHCDWCRKQVHTLTDRYEDFRARNADVAAVLPEPAERASRWVDRYDPPFPLLADPDRTVADAYDQPTQLGGLGAANDFLGRLPATFVLDARSEEPRFAWANRGDSPRDRPDVDEVCAKLDALVG